MASFTSMMEANSTAISMAMSERHLALFNTKMENGQSIYKVLILQLWIMLSAEDHMLSLKLKRKYINFEGNDY